MFSARPPFLYIVQLGFAGLGPVFLSSSLRLSEIGEDQGPGGLHTIRFSDRNITYMGEGAESFTGKLQLKKHGSGERWEPQPSYYYLKQNSSFKMPRKV